MLLFWQHICSVHGKSFFLSFHCWFWVDIYSWWWDFLQWCQSRFHQSRLHDLSIKIQYYNMFWHRQKIKPVKTHKTIICETNNRIAVSSMSHNIWPVIRRQMEIKRRIFIINDVYECFCPFFCHVWYCGSLVGCCSSCAELFPLADSLPLWWNTVIIHVLLEQLLKKDCML